MKRILFVLVAAILALTVLTLTAPESSAKQNCLAWERSARHSEGSDDREGVGRPAIDRLAGDEHYGQLLRRWVADNCMRLNHVQVLGTHNSYHVQPRPALLQAIASFDPQAAASMEYTHRPFDEQLGLLGIRQVELDVFADPNGGLFAVPLGPIFVQGYPDPIKPALLAPGLKVLHTQDIDFETRCLTFVSCLQTIKAWSDANSDHLPLMVLVEAHDEAISSPPGLPPFTVPVPFGTAALDQIDADIRSVFAGGPAPHPHLPPCPPAPHPPPPRGPRAPGRPTGGAVRGARPPPREGAGGEWGGAPRRRPSVCRRR